MSRARARAARAAGRLLAGDISFEAFLQLVPESQDAEIDELIDLVTHEPKRGGVFGASDEEWRLHRSRIHRLVSRLEES